MTVQSNILDPIHPNLDERVWDAPESPKPKLRREHHDWIVKTIHEILDRHGYEGADRWLTLILTGSLTTYQYSDASDCDVSLFVNTQKLPEWSRAEMIGIMVGNFDGTKLPGTPHEMQGYVVARTLTPQDLYKPGLRSGYDIKADRWIVPPEKDRVHDAEKELNVDYTLALESADKMERLLRYEPQKAVMFYDQIHRRRMRDQKLGRGDFAASNLVYKMLANRGYFPRLEEISGKHIATTLDKVRLSVVE